MDVHRLDVQVGRVSLVSGLTPLAFTDFLYLDIVQQETSLMADSANSNGRHRLTGDEVTHMLLPLTRCHYCRLHNKCSMEPWESDGAQLLGVEAGGVGRTNIERDSILLCLHCSNCLLYVATNDVNKGLFVLCSDLDDTGGKINSAKSCPPFGNCFQCSSSGSIFFKRRVLQQVYSQLELV